MSKLRDLVLSTSRILPARLLSVQFSRSGGPGGQNVNKVATKVDLRVDLEGAIEVLNEALVARIRDRLKGRLDKNGNLQVVSSEHRQQAQNVEAALKRAETLLQGALTRKRKRRPTRPTRASKERRLKEKKRRGDIKRLRRDDP